MKKLILPIAIIGAVLSMYCMSVDLSTFNRADATFLLMTLIALFNLYTAHKWWRVGFMTYQHLQKVSKASTDAINQLAQLVPESERVKILGAAAKHEYKNTGDLLNRIKKINESNKS